MQLVINGEVREVPEAIHVAGLLDLLAIPRERVAVEVNLAVVKRADHGSFVLSPGDQVEVVAFVGGG